ncbi:Pentafunctional AROM polypeptide [Salix suchowensis]|nr:Pentafunctional AROM polypeptide [Salix suchowensis]
MQQDQDVVSGERYRYVLTNFVCTVPHTQGIAHEKVEQQRQQLEEQERQVALLRSRIALLEGGAGLKQDKRQNTIDDFSIKNAASLLDKLINRWAAEVIKAPPAPLDVIAQAIFNDVAGAEIEGFEAMPMVVQSLLRHALSETISEGIINCLIVTNSAEANVQLTRIHEHIFARDPTVACVWRRQTFSAAVESCTPEMSRNILTEQLPNLMEILKGENPVSGGQSILDKAYDFSRMLHGSSSSAARKRRARFCWCYHIPGPGESVETPPGQGEKATNMQTVVRRAQVICQCAIMGAPVRHPMNGEYMHQGMHQGMPMNGMGTPPM